MKMRGKQSNLAKYNMPSMNVLNDYDDKRFGMSVEEHRRKLKILREILDANNISAEKDIPAFFGPAVSEYHVIPAPGIKVSQIKELADDIAIAMGVVAVRISTRKDSISIEIPNDHRSVVPFKGLVNSKPFRNNIAELPLAIGYTIDQRTKLIDLVDAPHVLIAGATKQGKSVCLHTMVASLLFSKRPDELKMVFIDHKMTEFSAYGKLLNHYLAVLPKPSSGGDGYANAIVTKASDAAEVLDGLCAEMEARYEKLAEAEVNNIKKYNCIEGSQLPYIVCFVDEYADLTVAFGKNKATARRILTAIIRLAQRGRAAGIHMIIATQRPSVDVITGLIKANFPTRIAFRTSSRIDSTIILDMSGAEKLIGEGDMLLEQGVDLERIQGAYISTEEAETIVDSICSQDGFERPYYLPEQEKHAPLERDKMFEDAARLVVTTQKASVTELQRLLGIGYSRASKIMDQLESEKVVSPSRRSVLVNNMTDLGKILNGM